MPLHRVTLALLGAALLAPGGSAQSSVTTGEETIPGDRSFYLDQPVNHPEALSGVWESPDGQGGAVGIHMELMTTVSGDAEPPVWTPQKWQHLNFGVFQRKGAEIEFGEEGFFSDNPRGGSVTLENGHLQLHFVSTWKDTSSVDLDLVRQDDGCWHGRFHKGGFDAAVTLCRPTPSAEIKPSPIVGTWSSGSGIGSGCIHIAQTGETTFTGWSDSLQIPGTVFFANNIPGPHSLLQGYGSLAKVHLSNDGQVSLELGAYNAMCCSHAFTGHLSADGSTIAGDFPPGPNQNPHAANWTRMNGDSCIDPTTLPKTLPKACAPGNK